MYNDIKEDKDNDIKEDKEDKEDKCYKLEIGNQYWSNPDNQSIEKEYDKEKDCIKLLSIDIGIKHLAFSYSLLNEDYTLYKISRIELIDISIFKHIKVCKKDCKLYHEKTFCDWIEHIFQEYDEFNKSDVILIERQPPMGLVAIEQLIFSKFRNKSILIHPISVHSFFNMSECYEKRKEKSEEICYNLLEKKDEQTIRKLISFSRQHDVTDTILFMLYWTDKKQKEYILKQKEKKFKNCTFKSGENINDWFDKFKFKGK